MNFRELVTRLVGAVKERIAESARRADRIDAGFYTSSGISSEFLDYRDSLERRYRATPVTMAFFESNFKR